MLIDSDSPQTVKLPVFLKTLCILTFISCGVSLVTTIIGFSQGEQGAAASITELQKMATPEDAERMGEVYFENETEIIQWTKIGYYLAFGNIVVSALGAWLMWRRKKTGFYIYTAGRIFPLVASIALCSAMFEIPYLGKMILLKTLITVIFSFLFVILYGMNLKHMNK